MKPAFLFLGVLLLSLVGCAPANNGAPPLVESEGEESPTACPLEVTLSGPESYPLGEIVEYGVVLRNNSPHTIRIEQYPPAETVTSTDTGATIYSSDAGGAVLALESNSSTPPSHGAWWPVDEYEQPLSLAPGCYELSQEYIVVEEDTGKTYTASATFMFEFVNPAHALVGDVVVNQSITSEGITITLDWVEMTPTEMTVYIFTTPSDYELPAGNPPYEYESLLTHSVAEYSVDGGTPAGLVGAGGKFSVDRVLLAWGGMPPVPVGAEELIFTITRLGDCVGRWEFRLRLD